jgi:hypothetical protein
LHGKAIEVESEGGLSIPANDLAAQLDEGSEAIVGSVIVMLPLTLAASCGPSGCRCRSLS